jgi:ABC-type antimicrobial peptide transport system permease subunit
VRSPRLGSFQRQVEPAIYFPMAQDPMSRMTIIVNTSKTGGASVRTDLQRKIESVPGRGPAPVVVETLESQLAKTALAPLRIATAIVGASAASGLALSVIGLLGMLSDETHHRRREFGVRIALGAQRWHIACLVLAQGSRLACMGALAGIFGSLLLLRFLTGITHASHSPPLWTWLAAPAFLTAAILLMGTLPARRALVINPVTIMRREN